MSFQRSIYFKEHMFFETEKKKFKGHIISAMNLCASLLAIFQVKFCFHQISIIFNFAMLF